MANGDMRVCARPPDPLSLLAQGLRVGTPSATVDSGWFANHGGSGEAKMRVHTNEREGRNLSQPSCGGG